MDHKIPVETTYENSAGNKIVVLGSVADRDKLNSKINDAFPDQQTRKPPVRLPTISIANITSEMSAEEIKNTVLAQNTSIGRLISNGLTFEVMSVRRQKSNDKFYSTVRVSNHIREHIEQYLGNRLYVGMSRCEVYDHFYIKRCNRCQQFNHYNLIIVKHPLPHVPYAALLMKLPNVRKRTRKSLYPHVSTVRNRVAQMDILMKPHQESVTPILLLKIC